MLIKENSTFRILALFWLSTTTQSVMMAYILSVPSVDWTNWINISCNSAVWIWSRASGNNCIVLCKAPRHPIILSPIISRPRFPMFGWRSDERLRLISLTSRGCISFSTTCSQMETLMLLAFWSIPKIGAIISVDISGGWFKTSHFVKTDFAESTKRSWANLSAKCFRSASVFMALKISCSITAPSLALVRLLLFALSWLQAFCRSSLTLGQFMNAIYSVLLWQ